MILLNNYITFPWRFLVLIFLLPRPRSFAYSRSFSCYLSKRNVTQLLTWVFRSSSQIQYLSPTLAKKKKKNTCTVNQDPILTCSAFQAHLWSLQLPQHELPLRVFSLHGISPLSSQQPALGNPVARRSLCEMSGLDVMINPVKTEWQCRV